MFNIKMYTCTKEINIKDYVMFVNTPCKSTSKHVVHLCPVYVGFIDDIERF